MTNSFCCKGSVFIPKHIPDRICSKISGLNFKFDYNLLIFSHINPRVSIAEDLWTRFWLLVFLDKLGIISNHPPWGSSTLTIEEMQSDVDLLTYLLLSSKRSIKAPFICNYV